MNKKKYKLSQRDKEILYLAAQGYTNQKIAEKIFVSYATVKSYIARINSALGAVDRTNAVYIATKKKII